MHGPRKVGPTGRPRDRNGRTSTDRTDQSYADPAHAVQVARLGRGLAELAPQPRQMDVDGALGALGLLPDVGQQVALADHDPWPLRQGQQQVELAPRERHGLPGQGDSAGRLVDHQVADPDRLRLEPAGTTYEGAD